MKASLKSVKELRGYIIITSASILWGTMGVLAKLSYVYGIRPETLIALRLVIGFVTLLSILALFSKDSLKIRRTDALFFLVLGVFAIAFQRVTYFYAINLTTATMAAILFYTYPVFVNLLAWLFLKEEISFRGLFAIVLTFLGVALVVRVYDASSLSVNLVGIIFGLTASFLFVLYFFMTKKLRDRYNSLTLTLYGEGIGTLALLPLIFYSVPQIVDFPIQLWLLVVTIAWGPSLLAYLLFSYALKHVKASKGSILSVIEPLSAALFSAVFIGERLEMPQIMGVALALAGVILLFGRDKANN